MICCVLAAESAAGLLAAHRAVVADGVGLVEWRVDYLREPFDLAAMLADRPLIAGRAAPVIVTVRLPADGGKFTGSLAEHDRLLLAAAAAGADYIDLEFDTARRLPRAQTGQARRVVSHHDFSGTPADLDSLGESLAQGEADVVKLATQALCTHDAVRMLQWVAAQSRRMSVVGLCMGELGLVTRILGPRAGAAWTYAMPSDAEAVAPGLCDYRTLRTMYRAEQLTSASMLLGVIGDPIAHSHSPLVHNRALAERALDAVYFPQRVPPSDLPQFLQDMQTLGVRGLSVTIPHKEAMLAVATWRDETVRAIGAGNTLVFDGSEVRAYNTDLPAAMRCLAGAIQQPETSKPDFRGRRALVLGAGGAARAIVHGLRKYGAEAVFVAARTGERAEQLAAQEMCEALAWESRHEPAVDILVNCTPLGMWPRVDEVPYTMASIAEDQARRMVVFDTVYNPRQTRLLREAAAAGARVVSGEEMFVRQAVLQFELFTGQPAQIAGGQPMDAVMREALLTVQATS